MFSALHSLKCGVFLRLRGRRKYRPLDWHFVKKEYNYEYEEGRIVRAAEADIELSGEVVTDKDMISTIKYKYDSGGNLISKDAEDKNGIFLY